METKNMKIVGPFLSLLYSRKFILSVMATVIALALWKLGVSETIILTVIAPFIANIGSIAYEDGKQKEAMLVNNDVDINSDDSR